MKIKFVKNVVVDVEKPRLNEVWDKYYCKWDIVNAESLTYNPDKKTAHILTYEGDELVFVPNDAFEVVG